MRQLLDFLVRKKHWFLFLFLEVIACVLIYRNSAYQRSVIISSANVVAGYISTVTGSFSSYLNLRDTNIKLTEHNGQLEMKLLALQAQLEELQANNSTFSGFSPDSTETFPYSFVMAKVVNNSVTHLSNYITINKGTKDGITAEMGVVSDQGVVGVISHASTHFSVILPLLNPKHKLSCKVQGSNYMGSLGWDGRDARFTQLDELPRHVEFQKGDTIVTSGYSARFPAGIVVGTIYDFRKQHNDNFYSLEVELATDFAALKNVRVLVNNQQQEQIQLEKEAMR